MTGSVTFGICTSILITLPFAVVARYNFLTAEEEETCREMKLVEITPQRSVSTVPMDWYTADLCCKMKGRVLHTIERMDEFARFPLRKALQKIEDSDISRFWIGLSFRGDGYRWMYGISLQDSFRLPSMREKHKWANGGPNHKSKCVGITPTTEIVEMHSLSCGAKLRFICQKIEKPNEEPLSGHDMMIVGSAEFQDLDLEGFSNLKFSKTYGGWSVAKAVCQARNWALIDHVHERYGEPLFLELAKGNFLFVKGSTSFHTAANDFCENGSWQWNCGHDIFRNSIPWSRSRNHQHFPFNNLVEHDKRCIQYFIEALTNNGTSATVIAKNVACREEGYIICDTNPECEVSQQYPCLRRDPHYINIDESIDEDMKKCSRTEFKKFDVKDNDEGLNYWLTSTKFTWAGAKKCCESKGWKIPAPNTLEELDSLVENTLGVAPSSLCRNELECDGFWTAASTIGYSPFSPLRYPDGRVMRKELYSSIRADAFTHPSCGRINYLSFHSGVAKYFHAHCLEKNFLVCEGGAQPREKRANGRSIMPEDFPQKKVEAKAETIKFNRTTHDRFNSTLTLSDLSSRGWELDRGRCFTTDEEFKKSCPNSSATIYAKPSKIKDITSEARIGLEFQNRYLLDEIVDTLYGAREASAPEATPDIELQAFQLLDYITMIYSELCPIVSSKFIRRMSEMFRKLFHRINPTYTKKPDMMSKEDYAWTIRLLTECHDLVKPVPLGHDRCGDEIVAKESCSNFICTNSKFEFNIFKTDLIVDFTWKMFELIHSACFPSFQENPMLHHRFAMSIVDLWESADLRLRWASQVADKRFWVRLLGPKFESNFINMERCNEAIINDQSTMFPVRLLRGAVPPQTRIKGYPYEDLNKGFRV